MKTIVLISCVSKKLDKKAKARQLYQSPLFIKSLKYAESLNPDEIYILSAQYHLLALDTQIDPYNQTLNEMNKLERNIWGKKVVSQLREVADLNNDNFILLAGRNYIEPLKSHLKNLNCPLEGMRIGERLQFLTENI